MRMGMGHADDEYERRGAQDDGVSGWIKIKSLGISVLPLTGRETAAAAIKAQGKRLLLNHNLHSAYLHEIDGAFRQLYGYADWVVIDGAPILWLAARSAGRSLPTAYRITSTDWLEELPSFDDARRLFLFGASAASNASAIAHLRARLPQWTIAGINGYVGQKDAVTLINEFEPDLVLIGLGMPLQEHFLLENLLDLPDATYATVGGAIDYLAENTSLAPRVVGRIGLEWAWRLANEPRRLAYRYFVEPVLLLQRVALRNWRNGRRP